MKPTEYAGSEKTCGWDPRNEDKEAQDYYFRWESERIWIGMKPAVLTRFTEWNGILYDSRLSPEFQFKTQNLDKVGYLNKHKITGLVPVVMKDSPFLCAYLMYVHTKTNIHDTRWRKYKKDYGIW